jgi:SAM-dependent methyltransferase
MEYNWQPDKYIKLVEKSSDPILQDYMKTELGYITTKIEKPEEKTFIEVGAGYGRVIPPLSEIAKQVIAVELDKKMLAELKRREKQYPNVLFIEGDAQNLLELLKDLNIQKPVVLSIQNILGTPIGNPFEILPQMIKVAQDNGEIFISLFIQEGLKDYGIPMYSKISGLVGKSDLEKTDFQKGTFISKTGYRSHWWTAEERAEIAKIIGGTKIAEITTKYFYLLHCRY